MKTTQRPAVMAGAMALSACLLLSACATREAKPAPAAALRGDARDARGAYRFEMSQHGKRMSADEFDAWMKANGIRVAKGKPGATRQAAPGTAKPAPKAVAKPAPKAVAKTSSGKAKAKTGKKTAKKTIAQTRAATSGEG